MRSTFRVIAGSVLVVAALTGCTLVLAQAKPRVEFAVASIKPSDLRASRHGWGSPGAVLPSGEYRDEATSVWSLVRFAYPDVYEIQGLPRWAQFIGDQFAIAAKPPAPTPGSHPPTTAEVRLMMRALLVSRFNFKAHTQTTQGKVYILTVGKGGPKHLAPAAATERPSPPYFILEWTRAALFAHSVTMAQLTASIARQVHLPVVDETGLKGRYSVDIEPVDEPEPPRGSARPSIPQMVRDMLRQSLDLELRPGIGPITVLVVDHVQPPSPD